MCALNKISITTAESYKWGNDCVGWHLLKDDGLSVIQEKMLPHTAEQAHYHNVAQQMFYILSGNAYFETGNEVLELNPGDAVHIPPKTLHKISNRSGNELHFLVVSSPKSHGDRINV